MTNDQRSPFVYRFGQTRYDFSGRTHIMGILNVTPDSFSDGGAFRSVDEAVRAGVQMQKDGADIIDVGGESSRPGSDPVSVEEELRRVVPVVKALVREVGVPVSVDTMKADVARAAVNEGALIVNDISAGNADPAMIPFVASAGVSLVVMHMKGTPKTMQEKPTYQDVVLEVTEYLLEKALTAERAGIGQVIIDPGLGFGKTLDHNIRLVRHLPMLLSGTYPVLVGPSRKSFVGALLDLPHDQRLEGTAAVAAASIFSGAHIVRVHDVLQMKRVARVCDALKPLAVTHPSTK